MLSFTGAGSFLALLLVVVALGGVGGAGGALSSVIVTPVYLTSRRDFALQAPQSRS